MPRLVFLTDIDLMQPVFEPLINYAVTRVIYLSFFTILETTSAKSIEGYLCC